MRPSSLQEWAGRGELVSRALGCCFLAPCPGEDCRVGILEMHPKLAQKLPEHSGNLFRESLLVDPRPSVPSTALWARQRGWRPGHSFPPRASLNDNQLIPGGDQGLAPSPQVLGLFLTTNRTVNVGPPASLTPAQDQHHC